MLGVRLPHEINQRLSALALQTHRSKSFYVKEAIAQYLDAYEGLYQAVTQYEHDKKNGTLKTHTMDEIMQRNGITREELESCNIDHL